MPDVYLMGSLKSAREEVADAVDSLQTLSAVAGDLISRNQGSFPGDDRMTLMEKIEQLVNDYNHGLPPYDGEPERLIQRITDLFRDASTGRQ